MIEKNIERIATALETIAAALSAGQNINVSSTAADVPEAAIEKAAKKSAKAPVEKAPVEKAPVEKAPVEKAPVEKVPSLEEVVAALQGYLKANGRDAAVALLNAHGAVRASDMPEDKRAEFIAAAAV